MAGPNALPEHFESRRDDHEPRHGLLRSLARFHHRPRYAGRAGCAGGGPPCDGPPTGAPGSGGGGSTAASAHNRLTMVMPPAAAMPDSTYGTALLNLKPSTSSEMRNTAAPAAVPNRSARRICAELGLNFSSAIAISPEPRPGATISASTPALTLLLPLLFSATKMPSISAVNMVAQYAPDAMSVPLFTGSCPVPTIAVSQAPSSAPTQALQLTAPASCEKTFTKPPKNIAPNSEFIRPKYAVGSLIQWKNCHAALLAKPTPAPM